MSKIGIENLKKAILFGIALAMHAADALKDKKVSLAEVFGFVPDLMKVPDLVQSLPAIKDELKDLDEAERTELNAYIKDKFDLPDDKLEAAIEGGVNIVTSVLNEVELIQSFKAE